LQVTNIFTLFRFFFMIPILFLLNYQVFNYLVWPDLLNGVLHVHNGKAHFSPPVDTNKLKIHVLCNCWVGLGGILVLPFMHCIKPIPVWLVWRFLIIPDTVWIINEFLRGGQEAIICVNIEAKHLAFPDKTTYYYSKC